MTNMVRDKHDLALWEITKHSTQNPLLDNSYQHMYVHMYISATYWLWPISCWTHHLLLHIHPADSNCKMCCTLNIIMYACGDWLTSGQGCFVRSPLKQKLQRKKQFINSSIHHNIYTLCSHHQLAIGLYKKIKAKNYQHSIDVMTSSRCNDKHVIFHCPHTADCE